MRVRLEKIIIICFFCVFLVQANIVWSKEATNTSQQVLISEALNLLKKYHCQETLDILNYKNPTGQPVIIQFYDLLEIGNFKNVLAMTADSEGRLYILLNQSLKDSLNTQLISLLLIHESVHCASNKASADWTEEALATKTEFEFYTKLLEDYPDLQYQKNRAIKRLNYIKPYYDNNTIDKYIKENSFYASHIKD